MKVVKEYASTLKNSAPIFKVYLNSWGELTLDPIGKTKCSTTLDPIEILVEQNFSEKFNLKVKQYVTDYDTIVESVHRHIRRHILDFIEKGMKVKHPSQTKLYRFYRDKTDSLGEDYNNAIVSLYKYIAHVDATNKEETHVKNGIAALEIIMAKFGAK